MYYVAYRIPENTRNGEPHRTYSFFLALETNKHKHSLESILEIKNRNESGNKITK